MTGYRHIKHTVYSSSMVFVGLWACFIMLYAGFHGANTAYAQAYAPVIENFRLGAEDQLVIDRGGPVDQAGDVNGDGFEDILTGAGVGAVRVIYGPTNGFNGVLNGQQLNGRNGFFIINDPDNDSVLSGVGDMNADGIDDIAVGSLTGTRIIFGARGERDASLNVASLNGSNGFVVDMPATDVKRAGDVNGDGLPDLIVGNANASPNGLRGAGMSAVIFGRSTAFPARVTLDSLDGNNGFVIIGISAEDRTGRYVAGAGDFNHDGYDDVLIGAPYQTSDGQAEAGQAYLVLGADTLPAVFSLADIQSGNGLVFRGSDIQNMAGAAVAGIGDFNHDGIDDIAIGAPGKGPFGIPSNYPGEVYVLFGGQQGNVARIREEDLNGRNGLVLRGIRGGVIPIAAGQAIWGDMAGTDIDAAGDMNSDGIDDVIIGAPHTIINPQRKGVGQVYVVFGSSNALPSRIALSDLDGVNGFRINGTGTTDYYAVSVAGVSDFNADGRNDIMMGASGQGESYLFYGRETGLPVMPMPVVPPPGALSTGFPAAALVLGEPAEPLQFNERRDPTGPNPLPPGTPTDPLNPQTPGYTAPWPVNTNPVLRPGEEGSVEPPFNGSPSGNPGDEVSGGVQPPASGMQGAVSTGGAVNLYDLLALLMSIAVAGSLGIKFHRQAASL